MSHRLAEQNETALQKQRAEEAEKDRFQELYQQQIQQIEELRSGLQLSREVLPPATPVLCPCSMLSSPDHCPPDLSLPCKPSTGGGEGEEEEPVYTLYPLPRPLGGGHGKSGNFFPPPP